MAFNNVTRLASGKRFENLEGMFDEQGQELKAIVSNGIKIGRSLSVVEHIQCLRRRFPLDEEAFIRHGARRDRFTHKIMEEQLLARHKTEGAKQHFFYALVTIQDHHHLSDDTIIGLLWDMIVAGTDTTAISVEWTMAELIKNPSVQRKAQGELDCVIRHEHVMTELDFSNLPYLQSIAKESLRLHPPSPLMLPRRANANVKIGGYNIPKTIVHVNDWALARDPTVSDKPLEFRPERFLEDDVNMKGADFPLLPFGAGRRVWPGAQLGINLVVSMIGHLLHNFTWAVPDDVDMGGEFECGHLHEDLIGGNCYTEVACKVIQNYAYGCLISSFSFMLFYFYSLGAL